MYVINQIVPIRDSSFAIVGHRPKWHGVSPGEIVRHFTNRHEMRALGRGKQWRCDDPNRPMTPRRERVDG
jgi:hypothetical protein